MSLLTVFVLFIGCKSTDIATVAEQDKIIQDMGRQEKNDLDNDKLFDLRLYSDKETYRTTDKIKIWATLKYMGKNSQIKIWHSNPYVSFSISDGKEFNTGNLFDDILTSTILEKDQLYTFDYTKSGGYSEDDPDAGFWKKFYSEKDLYLPEGEYTVTVGGAFSLTEDIANSKSNLSKKIKIKIVK